MSAIPALLRLLNVSIVPGASNTHSLSIPGGDKIIDNHDIRVNACKSAPEKKDSEDFSIYELIVHESGHALGLSEFSRRRPGSYDISHPTIPDAVMNYDDEMPDWVPSTYSKNEPDCFPHPFDIMAVYALYQTLKP